MATPALGVSAETLAQDSPRRVLLVEADAGGGSAILAGYFRGFGTPEVTLVDLLLSQRAGSLATDMAKACLPLSDGAWLLPGARSHRQMRSVADLWAPLIAELASRDDTDVLIDLGRLGMESFATVLLEQADVVALLTGSDLPAVAGVRQWAANLAEWKQAHPEGGELGLIVVGAGEPYSSQELGDALGLPVLATIRRDSRSAAVFSVGRQARPDRLFLRQLYGCGAALRTAGARRLTERLVVA